MHLWDHQKHVWVFDMDGTLYSGIDRVWEKISKEMLKYFRDVLGLPVNMSLPEQEQLREKWQTQQTTIAYLNEYRLDFDDVVEKTHIPILASLEIEVRAGTECIPHLPGKKIVLTNSPEAFAHALLKKLGIHHYFDEILGLRHDMHHAKPNPLSYGRIQTSARVIIVEDWEHNLVIPHERGWKTAWFPEQDQSHQKPFFPIHVHKHITSLVELRGFIDLSPDTLG